MIKILKLVTGETLIADISDPDSDPLVVHEPMAIRTYQDEDSISMGLSYALSIAEESFLVIDKKHVLTLYTPQSILKEYYKQTIEYTEEDKNNAAEEIAAALKYMMLKKRSKQKMIEQAEKQYTEWYIRASNTSIH